MPRVAPGWLVRLVSPLLGFGVVVVSAALVWAAASLLWFAASGLLLPSAHALSTWGQFMDKVMMIGCWCGVSFASPPLMLVSFPSSSSAQEVGGRWVLPDTDSLGLIGATGSISNMICHPSLLSGWTVSKGTPLAIYGQHRSSTPSCSQRNLAAVLSVIRGCRRVEIEIRFSRLVKLPAGIQDSSCTGTDVSHRKNPGNTKYVLDGHWFMEIDGN